MHRECHHHAAVVSASFIHPVGNCVDEHAVTAIIYGLLQTPSTTTKHFMCSMSSKESRYLTVRNDFSKLLSIDFDIQPAHELCTVEQYSLLYSM